MNHKMVAIKLLSEEIEDLENLTLKWGMSKCNQGEGLASKESDILFEQVLDKFARLKGLITSS